jgi:hypothetical protein
MALGIDLHVVCARQATRIVFSTGYPKSIFLPGTVVAPNGGKCIGEIPSIIVTESLLGISHVKAKQKEEGAVFL